MTVPIAFDEVAGWGDEVWDRDVTGVAVDSDDRVYALRRGDDAVTVLDGSGTVLDRWGDPLLSERPHLISIDASGRVYIADDGGHQVLVFDRSGRRLEVIGRGIPARTGFYDTTYTSAEDAFENMHGGPPFNRPTKAVATPDGELFVSDGYRNCRVHRFSSSRRLVASWGGSGAAPGSFVIPHGITVDHRGRLLVCDRENDRIQVFSREGELLGVMNDVQRPTDAAVDGHGNVYVTELARGPLDIKSWRLGKAEHELPGRVTMWTAEHRLAGRIGPPEAGFLAPHAVAVDSAGAVYVAEVPQSFADSTGRDHRPHRCLHKFVPRATPV
ncbi:hypothetical protein ACGFNY_44830 [Streptomyces chartreusis]|uniref:hypothetical protein n=1 Tax=Streptomyces chartreusis TaxID=1969 RepID=UPI0037237B04